MTNCSFNTQPPKGGWILTVVMITTRLGFNTQPPKGGWADWLVEYVPEAVSTHSRLKAAELMPLLIQAIARVSTHSRLKAAGIAKRAASAVLSGFNTQPPKGGWLRTRNGAYRLLYVSTHSRLKAAGGLLTVIVVSVAVSTHSRLKAAGASLKSLAPSGFAAPISLNSQEKREREYNTAFSVIPAFAIS